MTHRGARRVLIAVLLTLVAMPAAVWSQERGLLDPSPRTIQTQLEASLRLERQALERLDAPAEFLRLTWQAYVQLRAAHANLLANMDLAKYPNPVYQFADSKIQVARDHLLWAREYVANASSHTEGNPLEMAATRLSQSARLIELVLVASF
jgi:hypothetical protein